MVVLAARKSDEVIEKGIGDLGAPALDSRCHLRAWQGSIRELGRYFVVEGRRESLAQLACYTDAHRQTGKGRT
ncbi:hypothetical protein [Methylobacterium oxalidis]|uniref:Uncharacterized protein n=1 Tax=Methylobacterium oxalidis TaxID=944322 RepID=A0A512JCZ0_9HYPH|nr:hypothetical protein [Methylobacterium oxalidis]GEP07791.1 hypothetical protein MOX02_58290 [Methylobacterium oxalidis]GLS66320.1 hypothetical protein GCM10007888_47020 [Methylobacterium oxalidis]